jgi:hypothetical protein
MAVRAKIFVSSIEHQRNWRKEPGAVGDAVVTFGFAYKADPNHENKAFWEATPSGTLQLRLSGKAGAGAIAFFESMFARNAEMYLDFAEAPAS